MRLHPLGVWLLACLACAVASAQTSTEPDPCLDAMAQSELSACALHTWETADAELNRVYDELTIPPLGPRERRLRTAQRAWIAFRDAHCEVEPRDYEGGSMEPMVFASCMADVTRQRTAQLQEYLTTLKTR